jgi:ubiquilin
MSDATPHDPPTSSDDETVTFNVKSNQAKWTLTLPLSTTAMDLKNKLATSEYANAPAVSQRLIYSGRVLKDEDTLSSHKVKDGNTMHLVKSAPSNQRQNPASQSTSGATVPPTSNPQVPQNIAAGSGNDPFAALTGARYAGFSQLPSADMFGADGGVSLHN